MIPTLNFSRRSFLGSSDFLIVGRLLTRASAMAGLSTLSLVMQAHLGLEVSRVLALTYAVRSGLKISGIAGSMRSRLDAS